MNRIEDGQWTGRRVFITGHSGFVGSWLSTLLLELGCEVSGYSLSADPASASRAAWLSDLGVRDSVGDIRDYEQLCGALGRAEADVVIHLAAQPIVRVGYQDPRQTMMVNIGGSINILDAVRRIGSPALVHITSDKCYRNKGWSWAYREIDELGGGCPYSVSKAAAELVFEGYASLFRDDKSRTSTASVRFGNIVGGGDFADRLVPNCIRMLRAGQALVLRNGGRSIRPWQHVLDVAHGVILLAGALADRSVESGATFNFAPPEEGASAARLATALAAAWGADGTIVEDGVMEFPEELVLRLDGRQAAQALSWRHEFDIVAMADSTVAWYVAESAGRSAVDITVEQTQEFLKRAGIAK